MQKIIPVIWFNETAEEAVNFYIDLFDNSKMGDTAYYDDASAEASGLTSGTLLTADFVLEGVEFTALNGGSQFSITPAISFTVQTASKEKIDKLWAAFSEGGTALMPLGEYPFSEKYGWIQDKFGVSWQLIYMEAESGVTIVPSLLFVGEQFGKAEEAMHLYTSIFEGGKMGEVARYSDMPGGSPPDIDTNAIAHASFSLAGQTFYATDGPGQHDYTFSQGISLLVNCETQEEIDHFWDKLSQGGETDQCGWLKDKYGVSWQIIPTILAKLLSDPDTQKAERAMKAMLGMVKLDISELERAAG